MEENVRENDVTVRLGALGDGERVKRADWLVFEMVRYVTEVETPSEPDLVGDGDLVDRSVTVPSVSDLLLLKGCEPILRVAVPDVLDWEAVAEAVRVSLCKSDSSVIDR